jgi:hypothetical protein
VCGQDGFRIKAIIPSMGFDRVLKSFPLVEVVPVVPAQLFDQRISIDQDDRDLRTELNVDSGFSAILVRKFIF